MQTAAQTDSTNVDNTRPPLHFGIYSTQNCVRPDQVEREEVLTTEIIRSAWRLERCVMVEHKIGL